VASNEATVNINGFDPIGWKAPAAYVAVPDNTLGNPQKAYASDNQYAYSWYNDYEYPPTQGHAAIYKDFNLSNYLAEGVTINGIQVSVEGYRDYYYYPGGFYVALSPDGGNSYTSYKFTEDMGAYQDNTVPLGGPSDTWGRAWRTSELSNANFRIKVGASNYGTYMDCLQVKVYYSQDTTAPTVTINQQAGQADPTSTFPILLTRLLPVVITGWK